MKFLFWFLWHYDKRNPEATWI